MKQAMTLFLLLIAVPSFSQVINTNTGVVLSDYPTQIAIENGVIDFPSEETLRYYGWRLAYSTQAVGTTVTDIPEEIQLVASKYTNILNSIFGDGAHTNTQFTEAYVATALALDDNSDPNLAIRLKALFDILNEYWARGEVWSFPYGQNQYTSSYVSVTWFPVEE